MGTVDLHFEYNYPKKAVNDWWTDLTPKGYIGKALQSINITGKEDGKLLLETRWKIMGRTRTMQEKLTLITEDHWTWQPTIGFGIQIKDGFTLNTLPDGRTQRKIHSQQSSTGLEGKILHLLMGRILRRSMRQEWEAANQAILRELPTQDGKS